MKEKIIERKTPDGSIQTFVWVGGALVPLFDAPEVLESEVERARTIERIGRQLEDALSR